MMESSANILFQLLRAALGDETEVSLPDDVDWNRVIDWAFNQGVAAMLVDGLQRSLELVPEPVDGRGESLERDLLESEELEDLRYELFGEALSCEEDYRKYEEAISSLARTYSEAGIEMMVLKGYGLSLNYPVPEHRPTGDIDVYLSDWKKGDEIIRQWGVAIDYSHHHHSVFSWRGFTVENHYDIENRYASRKGREAVEQLSGDVLVVGVT